MLAAVLSPEEKTVMVNSACGHPEAFPDSGQNADRRPSESRPRDESFMPESQVVGKEAVSVENAIWFEERKVVKCSQKKDLWPPQRHTSEADWVDWRPSAA